MLPSVGMGREESLTNIKWWWWWFHNNCLQLLQRFCKTAKGFPDIGKCWVQCHLVENRVRHGKSIQNESLVCCYGPMLSSSFSSPHLPLLHFKSISRTSFGTRKKRENVCGNKIMYCMPLLSRTVKIHILPYICFNTLKVLYKLQLKGSHAS